MHMSWTDEEGLILNIAQTAQKTVLWRRRKYKEGKVGKNTFHSHKIKKYIGLSFL